MPLLITPDAASLIPQTAISVRYPNCGSIDRRDERHIAREKCRTDIVPDICPDLPTRIFVDFLEIQTGTKCAPTARQHYGPDLRIRFGRQERCDETVTQLLVVGVQPLGPIQHDRSNVISDTVSNDF
jgi:hypothetical protein